MNVASDILPSLQLAIHLRVVFPDAPPKNVVHRSRTKSKTTQIEACVFLMNEHVNAKCRVCRLSWY
jgi:hypothetical protein